MALWTFCDFARVRLLFALFCVEFASFQRVVSFLSVGCLRSSWGMCQCTYPIFHRSHFGSRYQSGRCALRSPFLKPRCFQTLHVSFSKSSCSVCFFAFVSMGTTHIVPIEALQLILYPQRLCAFFFLDKANARVMKNASSARTFAQGSPRGSVCGCFCFARIRRVIFCHIRRKTFFASRRRDFRTQKCVCARRGGAQNFSFSPRCPIFSCKKPTAPEGFPARSPTTVLAGPSQA